MPESDNNAFFVFALGHYPAKTVEVRIVLRSIRPEKELLELDYLTDAIQKQAEALRVQLQLALPARPTV